MLVPRTRACAEHAWERVEGLLGVLRCPACGCYGHPKHGAFPHPAPGRRVKARAYTCGEAGCRQPAVQRLHGVGSRAAYKWVCALHAAARREAE